MIDICGCSIDKFKIGKRDLDESNDFSWSNGIVFAPTTEENLRQFAKALELEVPIILQGEVGVGKSFLINELSRKLNSHESLIELSIDDQTDSKSLFGAYISSEIPGEFIWQPGIITKAVLGGSWLVIEDIDRVPTDIIASLVPLLERRKLPAPERGPGAEIDAHPAFRIIATQTIRHQTRQLESRFDMVDPTHTDDTLLDDISNSILPNMKFLTHLWFLVPVLSLSRAQIELVFVRRFPGLIPSVMASLMRTYDRLSVSGRKREPTAVSAASATSEVHPPSSSSNTSSSVGFFHRPMTLKDVVKIGSRIEQIHSYQFNRAAGMLTEAQTILCLQEVIDVYAASSRRADHFLQLIEQLAECWGVASMLLDTFVTRAHPQLTLPNLDTLSSEESTMSVSIGRVHFLRPSLLDLSTQRITSLDNVGEASLRALPTLQSQLFAYTKHDLRLLEKVACCVRMNEPALLVGETGAGKTTSVQELATLLGKKLIVQNLSLSTDTGDLLGGYRPVTMRQLILPCYEKFVDLFQRTFAQNSNEEFLQIVAQIFQKQQWKKLIQAFQKASVSAAKKLQQQQISGDEVAERLFHELTDCWSQFADQVERLDVNLPKIEHGFAFAPLEGLLLRAMKKGHWLLLDEINLASSETLQSLTGLLDGQEKLTVTAMNSTEPVTRHPEFRVFAAMNPPTDVGKRELPYSLRSRFTEIFTPEMLDPQDLENVVHKYMADYTGVPVADIVNVYLGCRSASEMSDVVSLADGGGHRPHYSLRSLTRSMRAAKSFTNIGIKPINRALFEGFLLNFQTSLAAESGRQYMWTFLKNSFNAPSEKELNIPPSRPGGKKSDASEWVLLKPFWLRAGPLGLVDWAEKSETGIRMFVITKTVEQYLRDICAAVAANVAPILLQGPTSVGKTTMIEYLAARTGHKCVRINNHEHTDVQEYIGGYVTNDQGKLEFRDGLLVEALRQGHWIILDELNLAPSDVLEALNRLLDDNKELLIPETGELVHPVAGFMLFATQNPPGAYGGRKPLSRAFRNRFLELCVSDLPHSEVEEIVTESCGIPPKFSKVLVTVMKELQIRRQQSNLFSGKHGAVTTRDLIKWGRRQPATLEAVTIEGYMLLAEKLRTEEEQQSVLAILQTACKTTFSPVSIYAGPTHSDTLMEMSNMLRNGTISVEGIKEIAITSSLRRLWTLVGRAMQFNEPALLIGDTGSGKTTVCQLLAAYRQQNIRILNCHQSTETSDIIGGLRPVRGREAIGIEINEEIISFREKIRNFHSTGSSLLAMIPDLAIDDNVAASDSSLTSVLTRLKVDLTASLACIAEMDDDLSTNISSTVTELVKSTKSISNTSAVIKQVLALISNMSKLKLEPTSKKQKKDKSVPSTAVPTELESALIQNAQFSKLCTDCIMMITDVESVTHTVTRLHSRYHALFEWQDGPLVTAMKQGDVFVLDEINLAEDAVIERLNSVLESSRSITLAEKGGLDSERIIAHPNFKFLATMNPGGDFGKRELSPALRSRFTEIYVPTRFEEEDISAIVMESLKSQSLKTSTAGRDVVVTIAREIAIIMVKFLKWLKSVAVVDSSIKVDMSVRELLAWSKFISLWISRSASISSIRDEAFYALFHGIYMVLLDGLGIGASVPREVITAFKTSCVEHLLSLCPIETQPSIRHHISPPDAHDCTFVRTLDGNNQPGINFKLGFFSTSVGPLFGSPNSLHDSEITEINESVALPSSQYVLTAKSTSLNLWRILRALQISRPILLEGPPGVGKSSIVSHLATITGHSLVRINLSEHSEISDLLGTDLPTTSSMSKSDGDGVGKGADTSTQSPKFVFCEGVFLTAMRRGDWVLLDELNLAPQSVLEGLNACLDHRGEVFLPELNRTVHCAPSFRVFCAQNPMGEGGGRKGLPQSFLSRFSRVFVEAMTEEDMLEIALQSWDYEVEKLASMSPLSATLQFHAPLSDIGRQYVCSMVRFVFRLQTEVSSHTSFGVDGSPWEFNLRDLIRWIEFTLTLYQLCTVSAPNTTYFWTMLDPMQDHRFTYILNEGGYLLFVSRFRSSEDREKVCQLFSCCFGFPLEVYQPSGDSVVLFSVESVSTKDSQGLLCNHYRDISSSPESPRLRGSLRKVLEMLSFSVNLQWPVLLVGSTGSGKRRSVRKLAEMSGHRLVETCVTNSTDSTELLGSFEQKSASSYLHKGVEEARAALSLISRVIPHILSEKSSALREAVASTEAEVSRLRDELNELSSEADDVDANNKLSLDDGSKLLDKLGLFLNCVQAVRSFLCEQVPSTHPWFHALGKTEAYENLSRQYLKKCRDFCSPDSSESGGFEWVDGIVVEALLHGHWLLIDNINMCSASVLDRFNSLLERGGSLLLTESGDGRVVQAHPDFKVFFVMDPSFGEISRAMRNRCLELCLVDTNDADVMSAVVMTQIHSEGVYSTLPAAYWNEVAVVYDFLVELSRSKDPTYVGKSSSIQPISRNTSALVPSVPRIRLMKRFLLIYLKELSALDGEAISDRSKRVAAMMRAVASAAPQFSTLIPDLLARLRMVAQDDNISGITSSDQYRGCLSSLSIYYSRVSSVSRRLLAAVETLVACHTHPSLHSPDTNWLWSLSHAARDQSRSSGLSQREHVPSVTDQVDIAENSCVGNTELVLTSLQECIRAAVFEILSGSDHHLVMNEITTVAPILADSGLVEIVSESIMAVVQHPLVELLKEASMQMNSITNVRLLEIFHASEPINLSSKMIVKDLQEEVDHSKLSKWYLLFTFVNLVVFDRIQVLEKERQAALTNEHSQALSDPSQLASVFQVAVAIRAGRIVSNSKECRIISTFYDLVECVDGAVISFVERLFQEHDLRESSSAALIKLLKQLLIARDLLVDILMSESFVSQDVSSAWQSSTQQPATQKPFLPWGRVLMCIEWLSEHSSELKECLSSDEASFLQTIEASLSKALRSINSYFGHTLCSEARSQASEKMWEESGHPAVPSRLDHWRQLAQIKALLTMRDVSLPSFLDTDVATVGLSASYGARSFALMIDWVSLLASFYYSYTNETSAFSNLSASSATKAKSVVTKKVDLTPIVASVLDRMSQLAVEVAEFSIEDSDDYMQDELFDIANGGDSFLLFNKSIRKKVRFELESAADLTKTVAMEPGMFESISHISNQLASVLTGTVDLTSLKPLSVKIKHLVQLIIRYTLFDPSICRSLQSVAWCIDALPNDMLQPNTYPFQGLQGVIKSQSDSGLILSSSDVLSMSLLSLIRSTMTKIDQSIYMLSTQNLSNFMSANMSYGSQTLANIISATSRADILYSPSVTPTWLATSLSGPTRGFQMHNLELALRHVDAKALYPAYFSDRAKGVFNFLTIDSPPVSVSTSYTAKKKLSQLFRTMVAGSNDRSKQSSLPHQSSLARVARLDLLRVHILDIVMCCGHMFESAILDHIATVVSSESGNNIEFLAELYRLDLPNRCSDPEMSELLHVCFRPALENLLQLHAASSQDDFALTTDNSILIGRAWVSIGLLRAHLSMLTAPVDPTSRPAAQASLLSREMYKTKTELVVNHFVAVIESSTAVTKAMVTSCANIKSISERIDILNESAVDRPDSSAPFEDLFFELKSMIDSICGRDRVLALVERMKSLALRMNQTEQAAESFGKLFDELKTCANEENVWQGSAYSFIKRSTAAFSEYDDVLTPFLSALQNISFGLRMAIAPTLSKCEVLCSTHSHSGQSDLTAWWSSALQFPFVTQTGLGSSIALSQEIEANIIKTLKQFRSVVARAKDILSSMEQSSSSMVRYPKPEILNTKTAHLTLLLALSQINYYVGHGGLPVRNIYDLFRHSLTQFVEAYLLSEKQRRQKEAEKAEMYKYKKSEQTFESNEEREEAEALVKHFPDHLKDLKKRLGMDANDQLANETINPNIDDEDEDDQRAKAEESISEIDEEEFTLEAMFVDKETTRLLTMLHAQMVFVHKMTDLSRQQIILAPLVSIVDEVSALKKALPNTKISSSNANKSRDRVQNLYELVGSYNDQMSKVAILAAKSVDWSIRNFVAPDLARILEGGSLLMLGTMVTSIDTSSRKVEQARHSKTTNKTWAETLDRDLLLLLDSHSAGNNSQRPLNFHLDANPSEIVRATQPLLAMFNRAADLLVQYPGNELLLQVCKLSAVINDFHISTTMGKMLLSLEMLLRKAEEWEKFAAKHSSLQTEMSVISELIAHWRELELKSWHELLRSKELEYADEALNFWFVLAKTLNTLPDVFSDIHEAETVSKWPSLVRDGACWLWTQKYQTSESHDDPKSEAKIPGVFIPKQFQAPVITNETSSLKTVFETIDGFLRSSNVGQFAMRLHLVRLFALQLSQEALPYNENTADVNKAFTGFVDPELSMGLIDKVSLVDAPLADLQDDKSTACIVAYKKNLARVVFGIWEYYQQYLGVVRKFQDTLKSPLQEKAKDQAKIGKWDKINSYALIEHSERVHRKLNKLLREYQSDVLEHPISAVLAREIMRGFASDTGDLSAANLIPTSKDTFPQVLVLGECLPVYVPSADEEQDENEEEGSNEGGTVNVYAQKKVVALPDTESASIINITDTGSEHISQYISTKAQRIQSIVLDTVEHIPITPHLESFPRLPRIGKLCSKTDTIVRDLLSLSKSMKDATGYQPELFNGKVRYGLQGAYLAEELSLEVFSRLDSLRASHVNKSMKYRAVADLLSTLKEQGVSPYLGTVPAQSRNMQQVLATSAPLVCESAGDLTWFVESPKNMIEHGERYFVRNTTELNQLRTQVAAPFARDVALRDAQLMLGLSENLFFQTLKTRSVLAASLVDLKEVASTLHIANTLSELPSKFAESKQSSSGSTMAAIDKCNMLKSQLAAESYLEYFVPTCSLVVKGVHELLDLVRVGAVSHSEPMLEEATVLPVVDSRRAQEAIAKLSKVLEILLAARESMLSPSLHTKGTALVAGYHFNSSESHSQNATHKQVRDTFESAVKSLDLLHQVRECIGELVTTNVCESVLKKVEEWVVVLQVHFTVFPSNNDQNVTACVQGHTDLSAPLLEHLSQCVDECLLAVQKVQSLTDLRCLSAYEAALQQGRSSADSVSTIGCFGEIFVRRTTSESGLERSDDNGAPDSTLSDCASLGQTSIASVGPHLHRINNHMSAIIKHFRSESASQDDNTLTHSILTQAVLELVSRVKDIFAAHIQDLCALNKSHNKFLYVCLRIFRTLLAKGLCSDETKEGDGEGDGNGGDMTFEDDVDGTGMGEGEGRKDVSDQIETEDQLMGLKNQNEDPEETKAQNQESKKMDDKEEDNAVEMMQDFEGEMYDMPEDDRKDGKDDPEEDEGVDQEELEREIGEADQEDIVDEKQWDNDEEEDEGGSGDKKETFEKDSQMKGPSLEDEMRTKEDGEDDPDSADQKEGEPESDDKEPEAAPDADGDEGEGEDKINKQDDEEVLDKPMGVDVEEKKPKPADADEANDDADNIDDDEGERDGDGDETGDNEVDGADGGDDLPDDMNLDGDEGSGLDEDENDAADMNEEDPVESEAPNQNQEEDEKNGGDDDSEGESDEPGHLPEPGTGNVPEVQNLNDENDDEKPELDKPDAIPKKNAAPKPQRPPTFGEASADGDDAILNDELQPQVPRSKDELDDDFEGAADGPKGDNTTSESAGRDGAAQSLGDQESNPIQQKVPRAEKPRDAPNPFRPGDVNEKWHRHLNLLDREDDEAGEDEVTEKADKNDSPDPQQASKKKPQGLFEKAKDNEASSDQVMDATQDYDSPAPVPQQAAEDTSPTDGDEGMKEEQDANETLPPPIDKADDDTMSETRKRKKDVDKDATNATRDKATKKVKEEPSGHPNLESDRMLGDDDDEGSESGEEDEDSEDDMEDQVENDDDDDSDAMAKDTSNSKAKSAQDLIHSNSSFQFADPSSSESRVTEDVAKLDSEFVSRVSLEDHNLALARQLWSQHRQSTEAQSQRLCEQLRLILEATVASRLRGDYRTGKRLNMRKIISYVASGFRKDKIWLRRTKPAKREYQVMVMVDNSKSMTEAGPLALSALSVITNALTKLEVGEVSLLSFAEQVHVVHPFGTPFDDEAGAKAFAHFDFTAGRTLLGRSLDAVGPIFADALQTSSSGGSRSQTGTTLQLCFVISDARIDSDNRQQLESTIRNLAEQNVLVLLVIIDQNANQGDSIFNTRSVEFVGNKVVTRAYMDGFPFPYYIVIQQVEGLSDVLSEALKQWFEMIRQQSGK